MDTVTVESIPIVVGREEDGRWWADIESMPGVMAYGDTRDLAIAVVRAFALRVAADCIGSRGRGSPAFRAGLLHFMSRWRSVKAKQLLAALLRIGWTVAWQNGSHNLDAPGGPTTHSRFTTATRLVQAFSRRSPRKRVYNLKTYRLAAAPGAELYGTLDTARSSKVRLGDLSGHVDCFRGLPTTPPEVSRITTTPEQKGNEARTFCSCDQVRLKTADIHARVEIEFYGVLGRTGLPD